MTLLPSADVRRLVLAAHRLANVNGLLGGEGSLRQVQLLLPLIAEGQSPGLEQDTWPPTGEHLRVEAAAETLASAGLSAICSPNF